MRNFGGAFMLGDDECTMIVVPSISADITRNEEMDQPPLQRERKFAQARNADRQRKKLPCARLIERENRRRRFEPAVAARGEARRIGTFVGKRRGLCEPADVERSQIQIGGERIYSPRVSVSHFGTPY